MTMFPKLAAHERLRSDEAFGNDIGFDRIRQGHKKKTVLVSQEMDTKPTPKEVPTHQQDLRLNESQTPRHCELEETTRIAS